MRDSQEGATLVVAILLSTVLLGLTVLSVDMSLSHAKSDLSKRQRFQARQIADSGAAQALAKIKEGGWLQPVSGNQASESWIPFGDGEFIYYTTYDASTQASTIRAWGRVAVDATTSGSTVSPDNGNWDSAGYMVQGLEVTVQDNRYFPKAPAYWGNGGIEKPMGGFAWSNGVDASDPTTWVPVTSGASSYQSSSVPFQVSSLNHPYDYLYNGGTPTAAGAGIHPYSLWVSQNEIGQYNAQAWFANSAGAGDPTTGLTPAPTSASYDTSDPDSGDYPYAVDSGVADVQTYAWELWSKYQGSGSATFLSSGSRQGTYGDLDNPSVTFVTGQLRVRNGRSFKGAGILVIRDDYDPNVDVDNTPNTKANLLIEGNFEWTGVVIIAGWAPTIDVRSTGDATIVGSFFGEDSVQSGGEVSLDSATIVTKISGPFRLLYSAALFSPGGLVYDYMPGVNKNVVGVRPI